MLYLVAPNGWEEVSHGSSLLPGISQSNETIMRPSKV